ncbi:hypothetical protein I552_3190 [Mycobacterium xenopi 3993]|nr:hypothetical protein I552_3190 [Mycobacterium xenopi 3993]
MPCRQAAANIGASDCGYLAYWIVSPGRRLRHHGEFDAVPRRGEAGSIARGRRHTRHPGAGTTEALSCGQPSSPRRQCCRRRT